MEDDNSQELVNNGTNRKRHGKKSKHKRVAVEESVVTVEEVASKPKKKRAAQKYKTAEEDQNIKGDDDAHVQLAASAKHVSPVSIPSDTESKSKEKKKRKRIESDENDSVNKGKKRKQMQVDGNHTKQPVTSSMTSINAVDRKDERKTQHQDASTLKDAQKGMTSKPLSIDLYQDSSYVESYASEKSSKRRRKHRHEIGDSPADPPADGPYMVDRQKPKDKETPSSVAHMDSSEPKFKKRKSRSSRQDNTSIYPDPNEDTELNESARRALTYVHAQISSRSDWKFNKARQNWVVRNVWDNEAIPDKYFPSCVKYLASVRGNTRDILTKESKTVLDSSASHGDSEVTAVTKAQVSEGRKGTSEVGSPEDKGQVKVKRAEMIFVGLGGNPRSD